MSYWHEAILFFYAAAILFPDSETCPRRNPTDNRHVPFTFTEQEIEEETSDMKKKIEQYLYGVRDNLISYYNIGKKQSFIHWWPNHTLCKADPSRDDILRQLDELKPTSRYGTFLDTIYNLDAVREKMFNSISDGRRRETEKEFKRMYQKSLSHPYIGKLEYVKYLESSAFRKKLMRVSNPTKDRFKKAIERMVYLSACDDGFNLTYGSITRYRRTGIMKVIINTEKINRHWERIASQASRLLMKYAVKQFADEHMRLFNAHAPTLLVRFPVETGENFAYNSEYHYATTENMLKGLRKNFPQYDFGVLALQGKIGSTKIHNGGHEISSVHYSTAVVVWEKRRLTGKLSSSNFWNMMNDVMTSHYGAFDNYHITKEMAKWIEHHSRLHFYGILQTKSDAFFAVSTGGSMTMNSFICSRQPDWLKKKLQPFGPYDIHVLT